MTDDDIEKEAQRIGREREVIRHPMIDGPSILAGACDQWPAVKQSIDTARAGLLAGKAERDKLMADNARLRERLEIDGVWRGDQWVSFPPEEGDRIPDGIEARNATIKGLDEKCDKLAARVAELEAALRTARADALEEAATEAEECDSPYSCMTNEQDEAVALMADRIAAAIRALKEADHDH